MDEFSTRRAKGGPTWIRQTLEGKIQVSIFINLLISMKEIDVLLASMTAGCGNFWGKHSRT